MVELEGAAALSLSNSARSGPQSIWFIIRLTIRAVRLFLDLPVPPEVFDLLSKAIRHALLLAVDLRLHVMPQGHRLIR